VRSQKFLIHQAIGNPMSTVQRLSNWNADEIVLLDISSGDVHDLRRDDLQQTYGGDSVLDVLAEISRVCLVPLAFGGKIRKLQDIELRLEAGADKCVLNTQALLQPGFVKKAAERFGTQCIVVSVDAKEDGRGSWKVASHGGKRIWDKTPDQWAREVEALGAGEVFLNSVDRDGTAEGYDLNLIRAVTDAVRIPVIACGGVGTYENFADAVLCGGASAVAAANIFHFFELSYPLAKKTSQDLGVPFRKVGCSSH